jgi:hypothetical protein
MVPNDVWEITCEQQNLFPNAEKKSTNLTSWAVLVPKTVPVIVLDMLGASVKEQCLPVAVPVLTKARPYRQQESK